MIINLSPILKNSAIFRTNKSCLYPNFAPLKQDTVSFSGAKTLSPFSMKYAPNYISCRNVSQDAIPAEHYLNKVLHRYLDSYIAEFNTDVSHSKPILSLTTRIKSPSSIREKTISSYFQMIESESKNFTNESIEYLH